MVDRQIERQMIESEIPMTYSAALFTFENLTQVGLLYQLCIMYLLKNNMLVLLV